MEVIAIIMIGSLLVGGVWGVIAERIEYNRFLKSDEYRALLQRNADASEWLKKRISEQA